MRKLKETNQRQLKCLTKNVEVHSGPGSNTFKGHLTAVDMGYAVLISSNVKGEQSISVDKQNIFELVDLLDQVKEKFS